MLRISIWNDRGVTRLKMEGKLAHDWVSEAEKAWHAMEGMNGEDNIVVDLLDVSFVDDAGHTLLATMRRAGARLVGHGPLMSALIEEIEERQASGSD